MDEGKKHHPLLMSLLAGAERQRPAGGIIAGMIVPM